MSDTPIDLNLTTKKSFRYPPWMKDRIEEFREEYNDSLRNIDMDEETTENFLLKSTSGAYRRLLDLGMAYWVEHSIPYGFAFEPGDFAPDAESQIACPACEESDPWLFRISASENDDDDGITFDTIRCLSCMETAPAESFFTQR